MNLHYMAADAVTQRYHISCEIITNQPCKICRDANINHTFRAIQNSDCFEEYIITLSYLRKVLFEIKFEGNLLLKMEYYTENIGLLNALTPNNCQAITQSNVHKYV